MNPIPIKPELLQALSAFSEVPFTVAELTHHYLTQPYSLHRGQKKAARQFIYRNMQRMMRAGMMERLPEQEGWPRYRLTRAVEAELPTVHLNTVEAREHSVKPSNPAVPASAEQPLHLLRERLNQHRTEMLWAMGEAEEYEALCRELPELSDKAKTLYAEARERSALLLGRIKALESLLTPPHAR